MHENDVLGQSARIALGERKRKCTATNRSGERCGQAPIVGGFVCAQHGGKSPQAQRTARERLMALADPAIAVLQDVIQQRPACDHCGRRDDVATIVRAALGVLDRSGHAAQQKIEVSRGPDNSLRDLSTAELAQRAQRLADQLQLAARVEAEAASEEATPTR